MGSIRSRRVVVPLSIAALALSAQVSSAIGYPVKDYSMNGATGSYTPQVVHKDYSKNGATGDFTPPATTSAPAPAPIATADDAFSWGAAALGSAFTLLFVMLLGLTARRLRRRRIPAPVPARPSAA